MTEKRLVAMGLSAAQVEGLINERSAARAAKEWARSDELRDELTALGVVIMDTPEGVKWRLKLGRDGQDDA